MTTDSIKNLDTPKTEKIITAEREKQAAEDNQKLIARAFHAERNRIYQAEQRLESLKNELSVVLADELMGSANPVAVQAIRDKITHYERIVDESPLIFEELNKRRGREVYRARGVQFTLDNFFEYINAKETVFNCSYSGKPECLRAYKTLDLRAPSLGLEQDLSEFFRWLRQVKPKSFWSPMDRRGLEGGVK